MSLLRWFSKPTCPIEIREKVWIETRLRWFGEQFGHRRLLRGHLILPSDEYFPAAYSPTAEAARVLFERTCGYMDVPAAELDFQIHEDEAMRGFAGLYQPGVVHVREGLLNDPVALVATLAHEISHHLLKRRELLQNDPDFEWATDLATVFFGFGIFTANATVSGKCETSGTWHRWEMHRQGYLPSRLVGYALAVQAWLRGDTASALTTHLRADAGEVVKGSLRYLEKTGDSLLCPETIHRHQEQTSTAGLIHHLRHGSPSQILAALWELAGRASPGYDAATTVTELLSHKQPAVRAEAARTLARMGPAAEPAIDHLIEAVHAPLPEVRATAAYALGCLHQRPSCVLPELKIVFEASETMETAAWAMAQFGREAEMALPELLQRLEMELHRDGKVDYLACAVRAIAANPEETIRQLLDRLDEEIRPQAEYLLPAPGEIAPPPGGRPWQQWQELSGHPCSPSGCHS